MIISIQGGIGSFHHIVAQHFFRQNIDLLQRDTFEEVFLDTHQNKCDFGIIAIENSIVGSIRENYDLFLKYKVYIVNELYLRIVQNLICLPQINDIMQINEVHSHFMAIKQCEKFLSQYPHLKIVETKDTALSVAEIAKNKLKNVAAIASDLSAKIYNMKILFKSIETNKKNYTRFFVISKNMEYDKNANKLSIVCEIEDKPGSLADFLTLFKIKNINLTKIESRPIIGKIWKYYFYIDLELNNIGIYDDLLIILKRNTLMFKILGFYSKGDYI